MRKTLNKSEKKEFAQLLQIELDKKDSVEIRDEEYFIVNKELCFFKQEDQWIPSLQVLQKQQLLPVLLVDQGAIKFVINGADIMRPGITQIPDGLKTGDVVCIADELHKKPLAVGKMLCSSEEMKEKTQGKLVTNIHQVGDNIWNFNY